jgi:hypothetical protein
MQNIIQAFLFRDKKAVKFLIKGVKVCVALSANHIPPIAYHYDYVWHMIRDGLCNP